MQGQLTQFLHPPALPHEAIPLALEILQVITDPRPVSMNQIKRACNYYVTDPTTMIWVRKSQCDESRCAELQIPQ